MLSTQTNQRVLLQLDVRSLTQISHRGALSDSIDRDKFGNLHILQSMMTTVVLSPPIGPASSPPKVPSSNKNNVMGVPANTASIQETKVAPSSESISPSSTAIDLIMNQIGEDILQPEKGEEQDRDNVDTGESICADTEPQRNGKRTVSFECADIVEFEPTVYTTSVTSGGVPVGLSLNERSRSRRRLDSFEMERVNERVGRQNYMKEGYLDPQEREVILNNAGCKDPVLASVKAEVNVIIQNRLDSNVIDDNFQYNAGETDEADEKSNVSWYDQDVKKRQCRRL